MRRRVEDYLAARGVEREIAWEAFCAVATAITFGALIGFVFGVLFMLLAVVG